MSLATSGALLGEAELRRIAHAALRSAEGDQAEALLVARVQSLTRFANAAVHQNVTSREAELRVRVVRGRRVAVVSTNRLDDDGVRAAAGSASELARAAPENPWFGGLPAPRPLGDAPSA
ncbi:MAG: PmbA/TldA family metallopeptidase, partial [Candidatus Limnocylindria bacterium]